MPHMTDLTDGDRKLAFEFVELFMSVEWGLKQTNFLKSRRPDVRVKPDWKTFAGSLQGRLVRSSQIAEARTYLMAHPPMERFSAIWMMSGIYSTSFGPFATTSSTGVSTLRLSDPSESLRGIAPCLRRRSWFFARASN